MPKQKFYVVWKGIQPGVYDNWTDTLAQVHQYKGAVYKSFESRAEAEAAFSAQPPQRVAAHEGNKNSGTASTAVKSGRGTRWNPQSVCVDAACSGNPGDMEYRGVYAADGRELFHVGPLAEGTNNVGEFLAIVHALAWLKQQGQPDFPIYSDSHNAQLWVKSKKCRTKLERTPRNVKIFELIERAERWLAANAVTNPIIKWDTKYWGEIPADFGRK